MSDTPTAGQQPEEAAAQQIQQIERQEQRQGRHLAILLFVATLLGSLLGAVADLSEAQVLVYPLLRRVYPSPTLDILGSYTLLDEDNGISDAWIAEFREHAANPIGVPVVGEYRQHPNIETMPMDEVEAKQIAEDAQQGSVLISTEPLDDDDLAELAQKGLNIQCAAEIGYDIVTFVGHLNDVNPPLSTQDLKGILTGEITDWEQLGRDAYPINLIADPDSGTTELVLAGIAGTKELGAKYVRCDSDVECMNLALSTPGSLTWVSASWLKNQPEHYVNTIRIKGENSPPLDPMQETFDPDHYPPELIRPLYIYALRSASTPPASADLAARFVTFVRGIRGQEILEKRNFYTYFDPPIKTKVDLPDGFGIRVDDVPLVCR